MKTIVVSPAARADLLEIAAFIAEDNPRRAISFVAELEAKAALVAERPLSFPKREDLSPGLRSTLHGRYLLLFRNMPEHVLIVRVIHSARDAHALLTDGTL